MFVPLSPYFNSIKLATMNNKRKDKDPLFAEVKLTGEEFRQSVTLILPGDINASQLEQYIRIKV